MARHSESTQRKAALSEWTGRAATLVTSVAFWPAVCLLTAAIHAWSFRHYLNPDGLSYLDLASESVLGGPRNLVNGYWSPGYPALIALALLVFRPPPILELPVIHAVNFAAFGFALLSFTYFLNSWIAAQNSPSFSRKQTPCLVPFCYAVFLSLTTELITLSLVTPDLFVAGIVLLASGICCRIALPGSNWSHFVALGAVLGVGYYFKSAVLPLGLILIALLLVWPPSNIHGRSKVLLSGLALLIVSAPLIALVSNRVGYLSVGETGRLNYAWYANNLPMQVGWTGENHEAEGRPLHPPRVLPGTPGILEFATPVPGTYPLWYDPGYWHAGARVRFDLRGQMVALLNTLLHFGWAFTQMSSLFAGAVLLLIHAPRGNPLAAPDRESRWLIAWPITACLLFAIVHVEARFVCAFFVIGWLALYSYLSRRVTLLVRGAVFTTVFFTLFITSSAAWLAASARAARDVRANQPGYVAVGHALQAAGVNRGDRLATVGPGFEAYYARYTGTRIVASIVSEEAFRNLSPWELAQVRKQLAGIGVKALVSRVRPTNAVAAGWEEVIVQGEVRHSIFMVPGTVAAR